MSACATPTWTMRGEPAQASRRLGQWIIANASTGVDVAIIEGTGPGDGQAAFRGIELASRTVNVVTLDRASVSMYWHPRLKQHTPNRPTASQVAELGFTLLVHSSFKGPRLLTGDSNLPDAASWPDRPGGLLVKEAPEGLWLITGPSFVVQHQAAPSH